MNERLNMYAVIEDGKIKSWSDQPESPEAFETRKAQARESIAQELLDDLAEVDRMFPPDEVVETLISLKPLR